MDKLQSKLTELLGNLKDEEKQAEILEISSTRVALLKMVADIGSLRTRETFQPTKNYIFASESELDLIYKINETWRIRPQLISRYLQQK